MLVISVHRILIGFYVPVLCNILGGASLQQFFLIILQLACNSGIALSPHIGQVNMQIGMEVLFDIFYIRLLTL